MCMTEEVGGGRRDICKFYGNTKNSHAISNVAFHVKLFRDNLSLSLGLEICDVATHPIYTHSEFKELGVLSSAQMAQDGAGGVKSVIVVYVP